MTTDNIRTIRVKPCDWVGEDENWFLRSGRGLLDIALQASLSTAATSHVKVNRNSINGITAISDID
jgi:hypothetical protein